MKKILFFITHSTLDIDHVKMCLYELHQSMCNYPSFIFDELYIYNTHQEELLNDIIVSILKEYNIDKNVSKVNIFNYDNSSIKKLSYDICTIFNYCKKNYNESDRIFILKSD